MAWTTLLELAFIAAILLVTAYFHLRFDRFSITHGPEVLTTMGILGCFTGITIALFSFDPTNIQEGVPSLLAGIRTAFWASLAGVFGALTVRFAQRFRRVQSEVDQDEVKKDASLGDVVAGLQQLRRSLTGPEESSLISQVRLEREASDQHHQELIQEFRQFAAHMVENNQKAIIEALKEVIRDFNQKLSEQFGENFKQLNDAVGHLVVWQQQYREELDQLQKTQKEVAGELRQASSSLQDIVQSAGQFEQVAKALGDQMVFLQQNREILMAQQRSLGDLLQRLSEVTPTFAQKTEEMLVQIESGLGTIRDRMADITLQLADQLLESHREMRQLVSGTAEAAEQELTRVQASMAKTAENLGIQLQMIQADFKKQLLEGMLESQEDLKKGLQENSMIIKEGVLALDRALQKELDDALQALAGQLAALSNRFVEDYMPLTERLRELVDMSKRV